MIKTKMNFKEKCTGKRLFISYPLIMLITLSFLCASSVAADEGQAYMETGSGYVTGDFGTGERSELFYLEMAAGYVTPSYFLSIGIPYNFFSSDDEANTREMGLGDIALRGSRVLYRHDSGTNLTGSAIIKLPTADETKQLGSGETDYGGYLSINKPFEKYYVSFVGGYLWIGDTPDQNYNDAYLYGVGLSRRLGKTQVGVSLEGRSSIISGVKAPLELNLGAFHNINKNYSLKGGTLIGMSEGSPDYGLFISLVRWF